jgi:hypothetical protein
MIGTEETQPGDRKWWQNVTSLNARLRIVYGAGIAVSFSALFELAVDYGGWLKPFGIAMPLVIDVYWMTALGVATDPARGKRERRWAGVHAFFAISLSITGNIMFHEFQTGGWTIDKHAQSILVAVLACIPVVLTGTLTHLVLVARGQLADSGTGRHRQVVPATAGTASVPAVPAPGTDAVVPVPATPGTDVTAAPAKPAGEGQAANRPVPAARRKREADPELCERVVREFAVAHPRPGAESVDRRRARAEKFLAEFRARTGERANNGEIAKALGVHPKRDVPEIRAGITEPDEVRQEGIA